MSRSGSSVTSAARMTGWEPPKHAQRWQIGARAAPAEPAVSREPQQTEPADHLT